MGAIGWLDWLPAYGLLARGREVRDAAAEGDPDADPIALARLTQQQRRRGARSRGAERRRP